MKWILADQNCFNWLKILGYPVKALSNVKYLVNLPMTTQLKSKGHSNSARLAERATILTKFRTLLTVINKTLKS